MTSKNRIPLTIALALTTLSLVAVTFAGDVAPKHVKLLATGNSFTHNATQFLPDIAKAGGDTLTLKQITLAGAPIALHWRNASAFQEGAATN